MERRQNKEKKVKTITDCDGAVAKRVSAYNSGKRQLTFILKKLSVEVDIIHTMTVIQQSTKKVQRRKKINHLPLRGCQLS